MVICTEDGVPFCTAPTAECFVIVSILAVNVPMDLTPVAVVLTVVVALVEPADMNMVVPPA